MPRAILEKNWDGFETFGDVFAAKTQDPKVGLKSTDRKPDLVAKLQAAFKVLKERDELKLYAQIRQRMETVAPLCEGGCTTHPVLPVAGLAVSLAFEVWLVVVHSVLRGVHRDLQIC
ncbi:hypothetical protein IAT38_006542 [Cryptococcus sp. DSM 104549]